jgi:electron transport complex protein RnfG
MNDILKLTITLMTVCVVSGLLLGLVSDATRQPIREAEQQKLLDSLSVALPSAKRFSGEREMKLAGGRSLPYYEGYSNTGRLVGYALLGQKQGYQSKLRVLVGIRPDGVIEGIDVVQQAETPGLGARVDEIKVDETLWSRINRFFTSEEKRESAPRPWFQEQFNGLTADELRVLVPPQKGKGVQALTGATITSRALVQAVKESIELFLKKEKGGSRG